MPASIYVETSNTTVADAPVGMMSSSIADFLFKNLGGAIGSKSPASPFFTDAAPPITKLLELANFSDATPNPTSVPAVPATAPPPVSVFVPPPVPTSSLVVAPKVSKPSGNVPGSPALTAPETTFAADASMDEHSYIREVITRLQQRRFVTEADYAIALTVAQDRLAEARAQLETRSPFQKLMDWLGISSSLMLAFREAQADLAALTYAAGIAGLAR